MDRLSTIAEVHRATRIPRDILIGAAKSGQIPADCSPDRPAEWKIDGAAAMRRFGNQPSLTIWTIHDREHRTVRFDHCINKYAGPEDLLIDFAVVSNLMRLGIEQHRADGWHAHWCPSALVPSRLGYVDAGVPWLFLPLSKAPAAMAQLGRFGEADRTCISGLLQLCASDVGRHEPKNNLAAMTQEALTALSDGGEIAGLNAAAVRHVLRTAARLRIYEAMEGGRRVPDIARAVGVDPDEGCGIIA